MRAALLMWLIACGGGNEPASPPTPTPTPTQITPTPAPVVAAPACEPVIRNAATRIATESQRVLLATAVDRTATVMIASCEAEAWPANVLRCIATAQLDADLDACTEELTYRQHKRLHDKIAQVTPLPAPPARPTIAVVRRPTRSPTRPARDDVLAPVDCSTAIQRNTPACRRQYCNANATDPRCMIE